MAWRISMTKTFEEVPVATVEVIPTFDGNEIKFKPSSKLENYLIAEGEVELYLRTQHQPLPVVPEYVAEWIESYKDRRTIYGVFDKISKNRKTYPKLYEWVFEDENSQATFALAFITGKYEVEKPQLFYLKNKLTTEYLAREDFNGYYCHVSNNNISNPYTKEFTQQEIDSMGNIDSYEKIEVEE